MECDYREFRVKNRVSGGGIKEALAECPPTEPITAHELTASAI